MQSIGQTVTQADFIDAAFREQDAYFPVLDFRKYANGGYRINPEVLNSQDVCGVDYATWN